MFKKNRLYIRNSSTEKLLKRQLKSFYIMIYLPGFCKAVPSLNICNTHNMERLLSYSYIEVLHKLYNYMVAIHTTWNACCPTVTSRCCTSLTITWLQYTQHGTPAVLQLHRDVAQALQLQYTQHGTPAVLQLHRGVAQALQLHGCNTHNMERLLSYSYIEVLHKPYNYMVAIHTTWNACCPTVTSRCCTSFTITIHTTWNACCPTVTSRCCTSFTITWLDQIFGLQLGISRRNQ